MHALAYYEKSWLTVVKSFITLVTDGKAFLDKWSKLDNDNDEVRLACLFEFLAVQLAPATPTTAETGWAEVRIPSLRIRRQTSWRRNSAGCRRWRRSCRRWRHSRRPTCCCRSRWSPGEHPCPCPARSNSEKSWQTVQAKYLSIYHRHRHLTKIDWLRHVNACLVCLISTVSGCSPKSQKCSWEK